MYHKQSQQRDKLIRKKICNTNDQYRATYDMQRALTMRNKKIKNPVGKWAEDRNRHFL
jgi:hypothetical protein